VLASALRGQRRRLFLLGLSSLVGGFAEAAVLLIIARVAVSIATKNAHATSVRLALGPVQQSFSVGALLTIGGVLVVLRLLLNAWQAGLEAAATTAVVTDLRKTVAGAYLNASWALQSEERQGRLQELLTTYTTEASGAAMNLMTGIVASLNLVALVVAAIVVNPTAAVVVAGTALVIGLGLRPLRGAVRRRAGLMADANLAFATGLTEFAATTQEARIFVVESQIRSRLDALVDDVGRRQRGRIILVQLLPAVYQAAALSLIVGALAVAYSMGFSELSTLGAVVLIMLRSVSYGQGAQSGFQSRHDSAPYFDRLASEIQRYEAAALDRTGDPVNRIGRLELRDVAFEYQPGEPVLSDVSFSVESGEIIGIVGPSGAGKSTLVSLILRLREPTAGAVLVDGRDVRNLSIDDWYQHVTFVAQEHLLFAGSIADNVRFFRDGVSDADVARTIRRAHLHDDVQLMPLGLDAPVGERGSRLSGGQRARLCIARALVDDPDIIVFDEPTSSLDGRSEALMRQTMRELAPRTTVFVIAHRLSTLTMCQRIMVINGGTLQSFEEPGHLAESNSFYREVLELSQLR
jgi:ABC-type multidrug transport system fused ATPase/permease subunit